MRCRSIARLTSPYNHMKPNMITSITTKAMMRVSSRLILPPNSTHLCLPLKSALAAQLRPPPWNLLYRREARYLAQLAQQHRHQRPRAQPPLAQRSQKWRIQFVRRQQRLLLLLLFGRKALLCRLYLLGDHSTRHDWRSLTTDPLAQAKAGQASFLMTTTTELNLTLHLMYPMVLSICLLKITRLPIVLMSRIMSPLMSTSPKIPSSPTAKDLRQNWI